MKEDHCLAAWHLKGTQVAVLRTIQQLRNRRRYPFLARRELKPYASNRRAIVHTPKLGAESAEALSPRGRSKTLNNLHPRFLYPIASGDRNGKGRELEVLKWHTPRVDVGQSRRARRAQGLVAFNVRCNNLAFLVEEPVLDHVAASALLPNEILQ